MSIIRENLLNQHGYTPYCGGAMDPGSRCRMPRTFWTGEQFKCPQCDWTSEFPAEFIVEYKAFRETWRAEGCA